MWEDPIVAEVRQTREAHAAQFGYDLQALYRALKEEEQRDPRPKVSFPPRPARTPARSRLGGTATESHDDVALLLREFAAWDAASSEDAVRIDNLLSETP